jgi:transcriptional regulator with XRE-family HTH domain
MLLITATKAQKILAEHIRARRLAMNLTQEGLSVRSGVPLPTLRKFEQQGTLSLESFVKILMVVGGLEEMMKAVEPTPMQFSSIDEVLAAEKSTPRRKRGRSK